jgi:hypothetical protein
MSDLSNDTKKHTTKSRETIPLNISLLFQMRVLVLVLVVAQLAGGRSIIGPPLAPLGAPDSFSLFHPVLPVSGRGQGQAAADTDRTVPVFQLSAANKDGEKVRDIFPWRSRNLKRAWTEPYHFGVVPTPAFTLKKFYSITCADFKTFPKRVYLYSLYNNLFWYKSHLIRINISYFLSRIEMFFLVV